jgi:hypothetical protein
MIYIKKFNESTSNENRITEYFLDFTDSGFVLDKHLNSIKLKYTGEYNFNDVLEMYNDSINKIQAFVGEITKTDFSYKKSVVNILIEYKNIIQTVDKIEITLRGEKLKLIPHAYSIYGNPEPEQIRFSSNHPQLGKPRPAYVNCIILFCKDEDNKNHNITWENRYGNALSKEDISVKVHNTNININLENTTKVIETIKKNEIESRYSAEKMLDTFNKTITPELLVK